MDPKIEVVLELIKRGKENVEKFSKYGEGMYSGPIMAQLARKSLAYLQDAEAKLKSIGEATNGEVSAPVPTKAPAQPVATPPPAAQPVPAPPVRLEVRWEALKTECPVCHEVASLGLTATMQQGQGKAVIGMIVCSECIVQGLPVTEPSTPDSTELSPPPSDKLTGGEIILPE